MKVSKDWEFRAVTLLGVGHMPAKGADEQEAAGVYLAATRASQRLMIGWGWGGGKFRRPYITEKTIFARRLSLIRTGIRIMTLVQTQHAASASRAVALLLNPPTDTFSTFLLQRLHEALFDYSADSFKAPALNSHLRVVELSRIGGQAENQEFIHASVESFFFGSRLEHSKRPSNTRWAEKNYAEVAHSCKEWLGK